LEFAEVLKQRHSMRMFTRQPVEAEKLQRLLEMTNTAPSAYNLQSYEAFVVKDPTKKVALSAAAFDQSFARQNFISEAPLVLVFCADPSRAGGRYGSRGADLYGLQDATIAATFAHLAAVDLGLSSVWVGAFDEAKVAEILGISGLRPVTMLPVGYPGTEARATARRGLREVFHEL
jgi:nitroreductase